MKTVHGADFYANKRHKGEDGASSGGGGECGAPSARDKAKAGRASKAGVSFAEVGLIVFHYERQCFRQDRVKFKEEVKMYFSENEETQK